MHHRTATGVGRSDPRIEMSWSQYLRLCSGLHEGMTSRHAQKVARLWTKTSLKVLRFGKQSWGNSVCTTGTIEEKYPSNGSSMPQSSCVLTQLRCNHCPYETEEGVDGRDPEISVTFLTKIKGNTTNFSYQIGADIDQRFEASGIGKSTFRILALEALVTKQIPSA